MVINKAEDKGGSTKWKYGNVRDVEKPCVSSWYFCLANLKFLNFTHFIINRKRA